MSFCMKFCLSMLLSSKTTHVGFINSAVNLVPFYPGPWCVPGIMLFLWSYTVYKPLESFPHWGTGHTIPAYVSTALQMI